MTDNVISSILFPLENVATSDLEGLTRPLSTFALLRFFEIALICNNFSWLKWQPEYVQFLIFSSGSQNIFFNFLDGGNENSIITPLKLLKEFFSSYFSYSLDIFRKLWRNFNYLTLKMKAPHEKKDLLAGSLALDST